MVVAIVAVLAAIALPNFINYSLRAKSAEAIAMIGSVITNQEAYCAEFENYVAVDPQPAQSPGTKKVPWNQVPCPSNCTRQTPQNCTSFECIGFQSPAQVYFQYGTGTILASGGVPAEYSIGAGADLDGDGKIGSFAYRSANYGGVSGRVYDGVSGCPADISAQEIRRCAPTSF